MIKTILYEHDLASYDFCIRINIVLNLPHVNIYNISYRLSQAMVKCLKIHCDRIIDDKDYLTDIVIPELSKKLGINITGYGIASHLYSTVYLVLQDDILDFIKPLCATNEWNYYIRDKKIENNIICIHNKAHKRSFIKRIIREHGEYIREIFINNVIGDFDNFIDGDEVAVLFKDIRDVSNRE